MTSKKKILIIISVFIILVLIVGVIIALALDDKGDSQQNNQNSSDQNTIPEQDPDSDFLGMSGNCTPLNDNQWYRSDSTLTLDPVDSKIINIFIEKRGFFRSENSGLTWEYKSKGIKGFNAPDLYKNRPCYLEFRASIIDPTNPNRILLGALGDMNYISSTINQAGGILETLDGGETWNQILTDGVVAYIHDIAIDPVNPEVIYYITSSQKGMGQDSTLLTKGLVYKTENGGKSWTELNTGLLPDTGAQNIHLNPDNPKQLIVTVSTFGRNPDGTRKASVETLGILRSEDAGLTWQSYKSLPEGDTTILESFISPTNFNNLYLSVMSDTGAKSYFSTDGGKTFSKSVFPMDIVAYDPNDLSGNKMVGYAWQSGFKSFYKSSDAGKTWQQSGSLPIEITNISDPKLRIQKIIIDPKDSNNILMAGANAYVWNSKDGGLTWKTLLSLETLP